MWLEQHPPPASISTQSFGAIEIRNGDTATVTITYVQTARCEQVSVAGTISQVVFDGVGGCGGLPPEQYRMGESTKIGPAAAGGSLTFRISSPGGSVVSGAYPNYTVSLYDELGDDRDDVVLSVRMASDSNEVKIRPVSGSYNVRPAGLGDNKLLLEVGVYDRAGNPVPNREVTLTRSAREGSGGHNHHEGRPIGTINPSSPVNTGASGVVQITYEAPEVSGYVEITGKSADAKDGKAVVLVGVLGLAPLPAGTTYDLIGQTGTHPDNHFGTPDFIAALQQLANEFHEAHQRKLAYNDMSLELGGVFDIRANWSRPHGEHRLGTNADLRTRDWSNVQLDFIRRRWQRLGGTVYDETDTSSPHYHLRY